MKHLRMFALIASLVALVGLTSACRSKTTPTPEPAPPPVTDTVAPVEPTTVEQPDFVPEQQVTTEELPSDLAELNRQAQERGWIRDAFFSYDESTLTADAQDALATSATWLKAHPEYNLLIEGHCDERGTEQYNLALGDRRANTAKDYLVTLGVDAARIRTTSYGEERPFAQGADESAWRQNRRAHLVLAGK